MSQRTDVDWAAVKAAYDAAEKTVQQVAEDFGISRSALDRRAAKYNWRRRHPPVPPDRSALVTRLLRLLERQMRHMELNLTGTDEKEVALLGTMARTLEKLTELDTREKAQQTAARKHSRDIEEIRRKLAARIDDLRKG